MKNKIQTTKSTFEIVPNNCYYATDKDVNYFNTNEDEIILKYDYNEVYNEININNKEAKIYSLSQLDRRKHIYILGKTGMGKTTLMENMILQDIYNGFGVCYIDPHGDSTEYILKRIPKHRQNDVVIIDPGDTDYPVGFNILQPEFNTKNYLIASGLMAVFQKIWQGMWSSRMEYILNNTLLALLEIKNATLLDVIKMLTDDKFRNKIVENLKDPLTKNFWQKEFATFNAKYKQEAISPILNKVGQFLAVSPIRNILGQAKSTINLRKIIDEKKILLVNVSKGKLGEDNSNLFGSLLITRLQLSAMSRITQEEESRTDFYLYIDEFQNFTTDSFAVILSEARKYRLSLILAHQYLAQLNESGNGKLKNAIFGNVGTIITFRLGSIDSEIVSKEFSNKFDIQTFLNLKQGQIAVKTIDNKKIIPEFLAFTLPPIFEKLTTNKQFIIDLSRIKYTKPKNLVETKIESRFNFEQNKKFTKKNIYLEKKIEENKNIKEIKNNTTLELKIPKQNQTNKERTLAIVKQNTKTNMQLSEKTILDFKNKNNKKDNQKDYFEVPL